MGEWEVEGEWGEGGFERVRAGRDRNVFYAEVLGFAEGEWVVLGGVLWEGGGVGVEVA